MSSFQRMNERHARHTCVLSLLIAATWMVRLGAEDVSFNEDVRPILSDRCYHCHGPDAKNQDSEFRLDTRGNALADLGGYAGIVPGSLDKSEVHARIRSTDDSDRMPPPEAVRDLSDAERDILDKWIEQGANFETHWSFNPLPDQVEIPHDPSSSAWSRGEIDQFVLARMTKAGLTPNIEASREKWLRRVTFDLTGLPPTVDELNQFLADESAESHERVVDRLLASEACAERLATEWLDVARYSDSYGYQRDDERFVWPWRDWVIRAFHSKMPYDRFIELQLAGDLLPDASQDDILATTFNRLHSHKKEGGVAIEEFRVEYVADRTHTFAGAFLGLTMECCRCHDHKYDPITTKEYYQLSAYFANVDERGLISFFTNAVPTPAMPLATDDQSNKLAETKSAILEAERRLTQVVSDADIAFDEWLEHRTSISQITGLVANVSFDVPVAIEDANAKSEENKKLNAETGLAFANEVDGDKQALSLATNKVVPGQIGNAIELTGDDSVVIPGVARFSREQPFSFSLWIKLPDDDERAVIYRRSRGWDDAGTIGYELIQEDGRLSAKLCHFWPGDAICVETTGELTRGSWQHVTVTYDGTSRAAGLRIFMNGEPAATVIVQDHLTRQITKWNGGYEDLAIGSRYRDRGFKDGAVDEFRVYDRELMPLEVRQCFDGKSLAELLEKPAGELDANELRMLREYFIAVVHEPSMDAYKQLLDAHHARNVLVDSIPAISVMRERETPLPTYVLTRGVYDSHGEQVEPGTPAVLPSFPEDEPRNRLGLAHWLVDPKHPLTARVTVNRYWQMLFGRGLVRSSEDFGLQGDPPTHPQLLDWLARDFVSSGWDVHELLRKIVLSATYRQSSVVSPDVRALDPENRWLGRGPSQRLSAEMIRDNVLAVSGLLVDQVGGPPVKPYDLALAYNALPVDKGEGLYRRSLYTFWKRSSPTPVMTTMNSGTREVCRVRREIAASPLQALVLMNGPQFIEASRVLAASLIRVHGDDSIAIASDAFVRLTSRKPTDQEAKVLQRLYEEQFAEFSEDPDQAAELGKVGSSPPADDVDAVKLAAVTVLVNSIMNVNESVRHK